MPVPRLLVPYDQAWSEPAAWQAGNDPEGRDLGGPDLGGPDLGAHDRDRREPATPSYRYRGMAAYPDVAETEGAGSVPLLAAETDNAVPVEALAAASAEASAEAFAA